jgi:hypothetical protein
MDLKKYIKSFSPCITPCVLRRWDAALEEFYPSMVENGDRQSMIDWLEAKTMVEHYRPYYTPKAAVASAVADVCKCKCGGKQ